MTCWGFGTHTGGKFGTPGTGGTQTWLIWLRADPKFPPRGPGQKIDASPWPRGPVLIVLWAAGTLPSKSGWVG